MQVSQFIAARLVELGVRHVFGYQGSAILKLIDDMVATGRIDYVQTYHEQAAAFCADAYSRSGGGLGVAVATSGPGATNLITGIANAQMDSIATLFITGQDDSRNIRKPPGVRQNGFQDLDIVSLVRPITKYAATVFDPTQIGAEFERAIDAATGGRPGAALLDIPIDIQYQSCAAAPAITRAPSPPAPAAPLPVDQVVRRIAAARRPLILAGGGIRIAGAADAFDSFAALSGIPVVATLNGLDAHAGTIGFSGQFGHPHANLALANADLLLVVGARLGQHQVGRDPGAYTHAEIIHIDIDPAELGRVFPHAMTISADLRRFLDEANQALAGARLPDFSAWRACLADWDHRHRKEIYRSPVGIDPVRLVEQICDALPADALVSADVGQNQMWVAQGFRGGGRRLLTSSGLGSMGYALPAAIGACLAWPDRRVVAFTGDGGLLMTMQELMLVGQRRLGLAIVVFNNNTLGMMRMVQRRRSNGQFHGASPRDFACPDLAALAGAFGLGYLRLDQPQQIDGALAGLAAMRPVLIDVRLDPDTPLLTRADQAALFESNRLDP